MSFLTALGYAAGGFGQGRNAAQNYRLAQQQQQQTASYENQQLTMEQQREAREQELANANLLAQGLGPNGTPLKTALPPNLQRVVPHPVGPNYKVTTQDQINHLTALGRYYQSLGQTQIAAPYFTQAAEIQKQQMADIALAQRQALDLYNQAQMNQRNLNTIAGANQRNVNTVGGAMNRTEVQQSGATDRTLIGQGG